MDIPENPTENEIKDEINNLVLPIHDIELEIRYRHIRNAFLYEYPIQEIDYLRNEICKCIVLGLPQAAITLTNHLIEKALKFFLIYNGVKKSPEQTLTELATMLNSLQMEYGNKIFYDNLISCFEKGIISLSDKEELLLIKDQFRNAYSHADPYKTFGDDSILISSEKFGTDQKNGPINTSEVYSVKIAGLPMVHGIFQLNKAKKEAIGYFLNIDRIIRSAKYKSQYN